MNQTVVLKQHFTQSGEKNGKTWTRHDFKDAGGNKYQTFDDGLASKADSLLNQLVEVEYESESRGQYTNNNLKGVSAANAPTPAEVGSTVNTPYPANGSKPSYEEERQLRIMRQSALQRAIDTAATHGKIEDPQELFKLADTYLLYFEAGSSAFTPSTSGAEESLKF